MKHAELAMSPPRSIATAPSRIVAIGASAGGLESISALFEALPHDTGMAFVVVQHLAPDFHSMMDELIARHTSMRVAMARHDETLGPDRVYVLPPGKEMIVRGGRLALADRDGRAPALPIDTFFRALALDAGARAVAIVLSGAGRDGTRGVAEIKRAGGVVLAESSRSARFDSMPKAAVQSGTVDRVAAPPELARALVELPPPGVRVPDAGVAFDADYDPVLGSPAIRDILALLRDRYGLDFAQYRTSTVARRIQRRIDLGRIPSLPAYLDELRLRTDELDALYRDLLIGVTQFFRDHGAFDAVEREVIPRLLDALEPDEPARVWSAACATGEEAYSLAMLFVEAFEARGRPPHLELRATDVHQRSLDFARQGLYTADKLAELSDARLNRFFVPRGRGFEVTETLRSLVRFERHDVTRDPPPTGQHLVSCRNMLIYLDAEPQRAVLSMFHFALAPSGFLFLGSSESPSVLGDEVATIDDRWKLYQRVAPGTLTSPSARPRRPPHRPRAIVRKVAPPPLADPITLEVYDQLLDLFMPPGFLIDEDGLLLDSFAGAERLLRARARRPSDRLLELIDEELRLVIGGAIRRVIDDGAAVSYPGVPVELDGPARATVVARPLAPVAGAARRIVITLHAEPPE